MQTIDISKNENVDFTVLDNKTVNIDRNKNMKKKLL